MYTHAVTIAGPSYATGTVTSDTRYFRYLWPGANRGVRFDCNRISETGTCTLDIKVNWYDQVSNTRTTLLDQAGAQIVFNNYADGETGQRFIVIHPDDILGGDVDGVLAVGNNTYYRLPLPYELELEVVTGGTAVSQIYDLSATWLP